MTSEPQISAMGKLQFVFTIASVLLLGACNAGDPERRPEPFSEIGETETIWLNGTEPFWGGSVQGDRFIYTTAEAPDGTSIAVRRFAGNSGLGFAGTIGGTSVDLTVTQGECSDAMSDRIYPYHATLKFGDDLRNGCAWTDSRSYSGPRRP